MEKLKTNILLEVTDDIIIKYPNTKDIQQKPIEKCNREGMSIEKVILFFSESRSKTFLQNKHVIYRSLHMLLAGLKVQFINQKRLSLCILKRPF